MRNPPAVTDCRRLWHDAMSCREQSLVQRSLKRNPYDGELTLPGKKHEGYDRLDGAHGA